MTKQKSTHPDGLKIKSKRREKEGEREREKERAHAREREREREKEREPHTLPFALTSTMLGTMPWEGSGLVESVPYISKPDSAK